MHDTADDLDRLGFIDKRKQQKLEVLCLDPILNRQGFLDVLEPQDVPQTDDMYEVRNSSCQDDVRRDSLILSN